jgi:uncharacterized protein (TIGR02594 family)
MNITAYHIAERYIGIKEVPGTKHNPLILAMLQLDDKWPESDETPWCSAFINWITWHLRLPRSKKLNARSWLDVGTAIPLKQARPGFDVVILWRGAKDSPSGHVGFFSGAHDNSIFLLGGNQGDSVSVAAYPETRLLGIRRLHTE